jgi:putative ABC transport system permease protein
LLFTLVNGVVLQRLPYPYPDRLVRIFDTNTWTGSDRVGAASGNIDDWRKRATHFDGIAGYYAMGRTMTIGGESVVILTAQVSEGFFEVMAVSPLLGRTFTGAETARATFNSAAAPTGADPVVVISAKLWRDAFGNDPGVIGRTVDLERRPFRIVGVMPDRFAMPDPRVELWMPWHISAESPRDQHYVGAVGRLKPGISIAEAEAQLDTVAVQLGTEHPETNLGWGVTLTPLANEIVGNAGTVLWILLGSVGLVSLIGCANVSLLALIRALDHAEETAVRRALGASTARLLRESLLESTLIAGAGGIVGLTMAAAGLRVLPVLAADLPRLDDVRLDTASLMFIVSATMAAAALTGFPPAWRRARGVPIAGLAIGSTRTISHPRRHAVHDAIVVVQVALSVVLLAGAGLLVRSFMELRATEPGFDPSGVVVAPVFLDNQKYTTGEHTRTYYRSLFERLSAIPGVVAVGGATTVPTSPLGPDFERPVWPEGAGTNSPSRIAASVRMITPGYLDAMSMRLADGRGFDERDRPNAPPVIMVSEALARRLWPAERAVGRRLVVDYSTASTYPYEIVGVVGDVRFRGPRSEPLAEIYIPHAQRSYLIMNVVVKAAGDPAAVMPLVRDALKSVDPQKPAHGLYPLTDLLGATYARDRQAMVTLLTFAAAAVFLAAMGIYGVLSQRVRERAREIGIRMAMGADASRLVSWVVGTGARLIAVGLAAGALVAWTARRSLDALLFGVGATDGFTAIIAIVLITLLGLAATVIPSWRAVRIDPVVVLRRG